MDYSRIKEVNSEVKMLDLKGKPYAMVPERVTAFRKLYPEGFIITEIVAHDGATVLMRARAGYRNSNGDEIILGTGYAQEVKGKGLVNGTSYIENCETSAVGRALGMLGLGINGGGICSAEELTNAIVAQNQNAKTSASQEPAQPVAEPSEPEPKSDRVINIRTCVVLAEKYGKADAINDKGYRGKPWDQLSDDEVAKVKLWLVAVGKKTGAAA